MALNGPRTMAYAFKAFELDGIAWLFDDSSRSYVCSAQPCIFAEPLYWIDGECDETLPDPSYLEPKLAADAKPLHCGGAFSPETPEDEAWDAARESAQANYVI